MKNWICSLLILMTCAAAFGQNQPLKKEARFRKNRIYFGGSVYNQTNQDLLSHSLDSSTVEMKGSASFMMGYERKFNKRLSLALEFYGTGGGVQYSSKQYGTVGFAYMNTTTQAKFRYSWLYRPKAKGFFRLYSGLGAGSTYSLMLYNDDIPLPEFKEEYGFGYQIDAFCAEISFSWFGLWLETGYGYQGIARTGISFNFRK